MRSLLLQSYTSLIPAGTISRALQSRQVYTCSLRRYHTQSSQYPVPGTYLYLARHLLTDKFAAFGLTKRVPQLVSTHRAQVKLRGRCSLCMKRVCYTARLYSLVRTRAERRSSCDEGGALCMKRLPQLHSTQAPSAEVKLRGRCSVHLHMILTRCWLRLSAIPGSK